MFFSAGGCRGWTLTLELVARPAQPSEMGSAARSIRQRAVVGEGGTPARDLDPVYPAPPPPERRCAEADETHENTGCIAPGEKRGSAGE